jgi:outer membrane protein TolC
LKQNETLIYNTASAYYQALTYAEKGRLLRESEKQYETMVGILKLRYEQGVVKKSEYDRARVNYNNVQSEIQANTSAYQLALNTLKNSMGLELETAISIEDSVSSAAIKDISPAASTLEPGNIIDYRIDQKSLALKTLDVQQKKASFLPTISMYGKYGGNAYGSDFVPALGNWFDYSTIGVKATIPIFSGFKKKSQLAQSKLSLASQELTNKLNLQTYQLNVENASTQIVSAYTNLKKNKENLQLAKEMMDASTVEYREGTATLSSLLDAEYSYKETRTNYTTTLLDYLNARLSYYKNTGTITQFVNELK